MQISKDRDFYKTLLVTAIPIGLQNIITLSVNLTDSLMLGALGEVAMSSVTLANNVTFVFMLILFGLGGGSNVIISQYWGKKDVTSIKKILSIMYRVCIGVSIFFVLVSTILPAQIMKLFSNDLQVVTNGTQYLRILAIGHIFFAITNCTITILRSVGTVKIATVIFGISSVVNISINAIFIFGLLGAPALGVIGAAIGTVVARIVEFVILMIYLCKFEDKLRIKIVDFIKVDKNLFKPYAKVVLPVTFNELVWSLGMTMTSIVVGRLGTNAVAATSILNVINQVVSVFSWGVGSASAVIIGKTVGEGDYKKTYEYAYSIILLTICLGSISAIITFVVSPYVIDFYNVTEYTKEIANSLVVVTSLLVFLNTMAANVMIGILRGGGDANFVLLADVSALWLLAIPLGFMGVHFGWSILVVYSVIKLDAFIKVILSLCRVLSGKWIKDVTV